MRMASRYGHTWVSQFGAQPNGIAGAEWRDTLAGLTRQHIDAGFTADKTRAAEWPPSSPLFRSLCLGIPTIAHVRAAFAQRLDKTPFERLVWSCIRDTFAYQRASTDKADRMIADAYAVAKAHVMAGGELPDDVAGALEYA